MEIAFPRRLAGAAAIVAFAATCTAARADVVGIVRGTVVTSSGAPVPGAVVRLAGGGRTLTATSGAGGAFVFPRVPFGRYAVSATGAAGTAAGNVDVATGAVADVRLALSTVIGNARATTTGVGGTPVAENSYGAQELSALPANGSIERIIETLPGVVRFSFDEPVANGFHGLMYELDGAPIPQATSTNLSQVVDPRFASSIEVFTGAIPAEFGGFRMGALVNVISGNEAALGNTGSLTEGIGTDGIGRLQLLQHLALSPGGAELTIAANADRTDRGIDTPSQDAQHDQSGLGDAFLHFTDPLPGRNFLTADISTQNATYQIPLNTVFSPNSPVVSPPGTDDAQHEIQQFATVSFTHTSADGLGYVRVVPWLRDEQFRYLGDVGNDIATVLDNPDGSFNAYQNALTQNLQAAYAGVSVSAGRVTGHHAVKAGVDLDSESVSSATTVVCGPNVPPVCGENVFTDDESKRGSNTGIYAQDNWTPTDRTALNYGLRYDASTGYVSASQLSPRIELNQEVGRGTIAHAYAGRMYAAPGLEDTRRDAVLTGTASNANPVYDLQPEHDSYLELGLARQFTAQTRAYVNVFRRNVTDVLDTTNLLNTPLFIVYNSTVGIDRGLEARIESRTADSYAGLSFTNQKSLAGGISGSTFLLGPPGTPNDVALFPEDHDQTYTGNLVLSRFFGPSRLGYATLETEYGTGFPVAFADGSTGRLPAHFVEDLTVGRKVDAKHRIGYSLDIENAFDDRYLIKVNNGFNTTQWDAPREIVVRLTEGW